MIGYGSQIRWFPVRDEIRTRLPTQKTEEMYAYDTFAVNAAIAACYRFLICCTNHC